MPAATSPSPLPLFSGVAPPVPGATLWVKSRVAAYYQERTGAAATTPAVADGDPIGSWKMGTGQWFVSLSDARRMTLRIVAGKKYVEFPAAAGGMTAQAGFSITGAASLIVGGKPGSDGTSGSRRTLQSGSINALLTITNRQFNSFNWYLNGDAAGSIAPTGDPRSVGFSIPAAGTALAWRNGVQVGAGTGRQDWGALALGDAGGSQEPGDCLVAGIAVFPFVLTSQQWALMDAWVKVP